LSIQIQPFGGENSMFYQNGKKGETSYSWRNTTIVCVMDCFYDKYLPHIKDPEQTTTEWQSTNDSEGIGGANPKFSDEDHRLLWGSHGDHNMGNVHRFYYPDAEYGRLVAIKREVDPKDIFTPNTFCVGSKPSVLSLTSTPGIGENAVLPLPPVHHDHHALLNQFAGFLYKPEAFNFSFNPETLINTLAAEISALRTTPHTIPRPILEFAEEELEKMPMHDKEAFYVAAQLHRKTKVENKREILSSDEAIAGLVLEALKMRQQHLLAGVIPPL